MNITFKTLLISLIVNFILIVLKISIGLIGSSRALIADGLHSFTDLVTDLVGIIGHQISKRPADKEHPYGHGKIEYITAMLIGCVIFALGLVLLINLFYAKNSVPSDMALICIIVTIIIKYLLSLYIIKRGQKYDNSILIASGMESRADVLTSIVVLFSFIGSKLVKYNQLFIYADKIGGIIISILIIRIALIIIKKNIFILLDEQVDDQFIEKIKKLIRKCKQVKNINQIDIIKSGHYYKAIIQISVDGNLSLSDSHKIAHQVEKNILTKEKKIKYITIHVNPTIKR
ncbi:MAG: cation diffusion facilitator family transporter [Bacilli bacterium]|jgi:cation diffusion facilitator family transporter